MAVSGRKQNGRFRVSKGGKRAVALQPLDGGSAGSLLIRRWAAPLSAIVVPATFSRAAVAESEDDSAAPDTVDRIVLVDGPTVIVHEMNDEVEDWGSTATSKPMQRRSRPFDVLNVIANCAS